MAGRQRCHDPLTLRIAVVTDLHQDLVGDAPERLQACVAAAEEYGAEVLLQLGDFATPKEENRVVLDVLAGFPGRVLHVPGNHEVDGGHSWEEVRSFLGVEEPWRAVDTGAVRFLLLDGNQGAGSGGGYPRGLGAGQRAWLARQVAESPLPLVLCSHQGPYADLGLRDAAEVREILRAAPPGRVLLWIHGHDHADRVRWLDGVPVWSVNSASYFWVGGEKRFCSYRDALFGLAELDLGKRVLRVGERASAWDGESPWQLEGWRPPDGLRGIRPAIRARSVALPGMDGERRYRTVAVRGWDVQLGAALDGDAAMRGQVLGLLDEKLWEVATRLPAPAVARLQEVPLWFHLEHGATPGGAYHPSLEWLRGHEGFDGRWTGGIEFGVARNFLGWTWTQPSMVLHELAHAWHHQVLGYDDPGLRDAWQAAVDGKRYDDVLYTRGGRQRHYGLNNPQEFFAEMSEAWWGVNDMYPFVRGELLETDPEVAKLVAAAWARVP